MLRDVRVGLYLSVVVLGACTFGRLDGLTGGEPDAGGPQDAGAPPDAAEAAAPPVVDAATRTTILSETFEADGTCQGGSFNSTISRTDQKPHGGKMGCRVCMASTTYDSYSYSYPLPTAEATVGARYHAKVWFRTPTSGASATSVSFALRSIRRDPYTEVENAVSAVDLTGDWTSTELDFTLTRPAEGVDFYLSQSSGAGFCFVLDDLEITRLR